MRVVAIRSASKRKAFFDAPYNQILKTSKGCPNFLGIVSTLPGTFWGCSCYRKRYLRTRRRRRRGTGGGGGETRSFVLYATYATVNIEICETGKLGRSVYNLQTRARTPTSKWLPSITMRLRGGAESQSCSRVANRRFEVRFVRWDLSQSVPLRVPFFFSLLLLFRPFPNG